MRLWGTPVEPKNKLSKVILGPDWVDLSYGDTPVVAEALHAALDKSMWNLQGLANVKITECSYQPANGYPPLVEFLEKKYGTRVIVTNGAKQGMAAAMYALKVNGAKRMFARKPYWPSLLALFEDIGLKPVWNDTDQLLNVGDSAEYNFDSAIVTFPNNPDDSNIGDFDADTLRCEKVKIIHDAAYYSEIYTHDGERLVPCGDMQVFTYSKMYGLGGLRVGYVVCHDPKYADKVAEFVERSTSSVSVASQKMILTIDKHMEEHPRDKWKFVFAAQREIKAAREEFAKVYNSVVDIEDMVSFYGSKSMFAWVKVGPDLNLKKAKVHALEGSIFGKPGYMRFNLAVGPDKIREAVKRLNKLAKPKKKK